MQLADVYVNIPVKSIAQSFTYTVPEELSRLEIGWRVLVPFGAQKVEGFVVNVMTVQEGEKLPDRLYNKGKLVELKSIEALVDEEPWFPKKVLELAIWIADFYLCSPAEIMRLFMPGKSGVRLKLCYKAIADNEEHILLQVNTNRQVYEELKEGKSALQLKHKFPEFKEQIDKILEQLLRYNLIKKEYADSKKFSELTELTATLLAYPTEEQLAGLKRSKAKLRLLEMLTEKQALNKEIPFSILRKMGFSNTTIHNLAADGLLRVENKRILRDSYQDMLAETAEKRILTDEQEIAVKAVCEDIDKNEKKKPFLLQGVTGSGKTLVYMEAAKHTRKQGKNVIVLVPEIALTGQLVKNFKEYFAGDIVVIHSRLSLSERNDAIVRVRQHDAGIIIGARSALFTPIDDIGLIIIDEEQDYSYKQDESPRYHARAVAEHIAEFHQATLVLGSATPSMESFYRAEIGEYRLLTMKKRVGNRPLPKVLSVDMRKELSMGRRNVISLAMKNLLVDTMEKKEQIIIMLNRRGFSTFVMCRSCGYVVVCPDCGMPMTYHQDGRLMCHHCDTHAEVPSVCPKCNSKYIKFFGSGTEKLEKELGELVPNARVIRMDRDTTTGKFAHTDILNKFRRHEYDVLLGTQMVAKGHDIPNVTAVGIISADSSLHIPSFRAAEQVFMLITQTAGRAGRGETPGKVIVQTYNPEHYAVTCGIAQDYANFYKYEISSRKELFYPPFSRLIKLVFQDKKEDKAIKRAKEFKNKFADKFKNRNDIMAMGPAAAMISNFRGIFRQCVLIKTSDLSAVRDFLREYGLHLDNTVIIDIDPLSTT